MHNIHISSFSTLRSVQIQTIYYEISIQFFTLACKHLCGYLHFKHSIWIITRLFCLHHNTLTHIIIYLIKNCLEFVFNLVFLFKIIIYSVSGIQSTPHIRDSGLRSLDYARTLVKFIKLHETQISRCLHRLCGRVIGIK